MPERVEQTDPVDHCRAAVRDDSLGKSPSVGWVRSRWGVRQGPRQDHRQDRRLTHHRNLSGPRPNRPDSPSGRCRARRRPSARCGHRSSGPVMSQVRTLLGIASWRGDRAAWLLIRQCRCSGSIGSSGCRVPEHAVTEVYRHRVAQAAGEVSVPVVVGEGEQNPLVVGVAHETSRVQLIVCQPHSARRLKRAGLPNGGDRPHPQWTRRVRRWPGSGADRGGRVPGTPAARRRGSAVHCGQSRSPMTRRRAVEARMIPYARGANVDEEGAGRGTPRVRLQGVGRRRVEEDHRQRPQLLRPGHRTVVDRRVERAVDVVLHRRASARPTGGRARCRSGLSAWSVSASSMRRHGSGRRRRGARAGWGRWAWWTR